MKGGPTMKLHTFSRIVVELPFSRPFFFGGQNEY